MVPIFRIKCADEELYWQVSEDEDKTIQLTPDIEKASMFQTNTNPDRKLSNQLKDRPHYFSITHCQCSSTSEVPAATGTICADKPSLLKHRKCGLKEMPAASSHKKFRFELRCPINDYENPINASQAVTKWKKDRRIKFFIKPANASGDVALAVCTPSDGTNGRIYEKLKPMSQHKRNGKHGQYHMLWTCVPCDYGHSETPGHHSPTPYDTHHD